MSGSGPGCIKGPDEAVVVAPLTSIRLHVRAIIRDGTRAFVGSQSLRKEELGSRREVGLLVNNPTVTRRLLQVFEADWLECESKAPAKENVRRHDEERGPRRRTFARGVLLAREAVTAGRVTWTNPVVFTSRNIGVLGGSNDGLRNSVSNT